MKIWKAEWKSGKITLKLDHGYPSPIHVAMMEAMKTMHFIWGLNHCSQYSAASDKGMQLESSADNLGQPY